MTNRRDEIEARACLILGVLLEDAGEYICASELFRRAISYRPDLVEAHVRLGFACWQMSDTSGMYEAFKEAVHLDPQAVRDTVREQPQEAQLISLVLYPRQYGLQLSQDWERAMPKEIREGSDLMMCADIHLAEGRHVQAIEMLESMLKKDPEDSYPVPLLSLAYLLLREGSKSRASGVGKESRLWGTEPELASLLFQE